MTELILPEKIQDLMFTEVDKQELLKRYQKPPKTWLKEHKFIKSGKGKYMYLPIEGVKLLLTYIYDEWYVEVKEYGHSFNAMTCSVTLHVKYKGKWKRADGVGAAEIQTAKGASVTDMSKINNGAIAMALPSAKSYALKNAAKELGSIFGASADLDWTTFINKKEVDLDITGFSAK